MDHKSILHGLQGESGASNPAGLQPPASGQSGPQAGGAGSGLLFLREEQMRLAQDLFFFAYRDLTASADAILDELDLGRAHHRALHFIGRRSGIAVSELLALLRITKQSLARVLGELIERGYVLQVQGPRDRRQRLLSLTDQGRALERRLFERQRERMVAAYRDAGGVAVEGFRRVMRGVMDEETRLLLEPRDPVATLRRAAP
jgi:DNA-binding MarR family transcriptional regulator